MEDRPPLRFAHYRDRAQELARSGEALGKLAGEATRKLARRLPTRFQAARGELATFAALLKAWAQGDYRQVSARTLVAITAAVLYFVTPFDLVPDFLAVLGLLDDAAVVGYVVRAFRQEIACFERWRKGGGEQP